MKRSFLAVLFPALFIFVALPVFSQEVEERVVDEVIAQVNGDVITLSRVNREIKGIIDAEVQQGKKREDVAKLVEEKRGELIANLINEELLLQKAKELGLDAEIDASVNRRFTEIMKQYNLKTLDALYKQMESSGVNPEEIREIWRKQATRDMVIQREVQSKLYWSASGKELKDYYEKHKAKFTKPELISLSEIFLGYAGRDENAVREKGKQLVAQIRAGADFAKLQSENSDPGVVTQGSGKAEKIRFTDLSEKLRESLKGVKVGAVTEPIEAEQIGVLILRVDAREQASSETVFDENAVRLAIMNEKAPEEQRKFFATLRGNSYIKISDAYRPLVSPILFSEERKEKVSN